MKNNWNKTVTEINRKRYVIPDGWDTREVVAESLECAPDRVADLLKPGIQSGQIERQEFSVWDDARRMTMRVVCYRVVGDKIQAAKEGPSAERGADSLEIGRVRRALEKHPDWNDQRIARNARSQKSVVAQFRKEMGL
jgi:cytochrome P450